MIWLRAARFLQAAWRFLASPKGRGLALVVAIGVVFILFGNHRFHQGIAQQKADEAKRLAEARRVVAKVNAGGAKITADVATKLVEARTEIRWRTQVQLQEVIRYVPVESDRACIVGVGALRLHDHALAGLPGLPGPSGGPEQADSGVPLSTLVSDDVAFAGVAYDWRAEAVAWREWYARQAALWKANIRTPPAEPAKP